MSAIGIVFADAFVAVHFVNTQSAILARTGGALIFVDVAEFPSESWCAKAFR